MSRENDMTRRKVLQKIGSAGFGAVALSSVSVEDAEAQLQEQQELLNKYQDETRLRQAFTEQAGSLKETLVAEEIVPADFEFESVDFATEDEVGHIDPEIRNGGTQVAMARPDGEKTAVLMHSIDTESHGVDVYVQPERDQAYARVTPTDDGDTFIVQENSDKVTTDSCGSYTDCTLEVCDTNYTPGGPSYEYRKYTYEGTEDTTGGCSYHLSHTSCTC